MTFSVILPYPSYNVLFMTSQIIFMQKKEKSYRTDFEKINFLIFLPFDPMLMFYPKNIYILFSAYTSLECIDTTLMTLYDEIEKKLQDRFGENQLLNLFKLQKKIYSGDIHPRNIPTEFEKFRTLVAELQVLTDIRAD